MWLVGVLAGAVYVALVVLRLHAYGGDPSAFVYAGDHFANPAQVPASLHVVRHSWGYDGQYYYALSLDPFTSRAVVHGIRIDNPPYRQQRIVYPLIVWALTWGHASLVPWTMILVNLAALVALGCVGGWYAQTVGQHALWGVVLPLYPGFVLSVARDTPEPLAALFVVGSLLLLARRRPIWATVLLVLALLTRETTLLVAAGALIAWLVGCGLALVRRAGYHRTRTVPWYYWAVPFAAYGGWQYALLRNWGVLAVRTGGGNIGKPLHGLLLRTQTLAPFTHTPFERIMTAEMALIGLFGLTVLAGLYASRTQLVVKLGWLCEAALAVSLTYVVWGEDWGFMRVLADFFTLGMLVLIGWRSWLRVPVLLASVALCLYLVYSRSMWCGGGIACVW